MSVTVKKSLRYSLIALGLLLLVLLAAPFFVDVDDYRGQIEKTVENATGRKLSIGKIHASLFPWIGVRLEDVHLANREGFSRHDFLSIRSLDVRLALMPLLRGEYEIKKFHLDGPKLFLERHADGTSNWDDLIPATAGGGQQSAEQPSAASSPAAAGLGAVKAEHLLLSDGVLIWMDAAGPGNPVEIKDINLALEDIQLLRPISFSLSGKMAGDEFSVAGQAGPLGDLAGVDPMRLPLQAHLQIEQMHLQSFATRIAPSWPEFMGDIQQAFVRMAADLEQRPDGLRVLKGSLIVHGAHELGAQWSIDMPERNRLEIRHLDGLIDGWGVFKSEGQVTGLTGKPAFQLRVNGERLERKWLTGLMPALQQMYDRHPSPWKSIKFGALVSGDARAIDLKNVQLMLDDEPMQISGTIGLGKRPSLRLQLATKAWHLDPWLPQSDSADPDHAGAVTGVKNKGGNDNAEPDLRFLKPWRISARFQAGAMYLRGLKFEHLQAGISGSNGQLEIKPFRFNLAGGKVEEHATLDVASWPVRWTESVHVSGVQVEPVLKALAEMNMLTGTLDMETNLKASGLTAQAVRTLAGRGNFMLRNGKVRGFDIAGTLRKIANPLAETGPRETDFAQLSGSFKIKAGLVANDDLFLASPLLRMTGHGKVNLVNKTMDYHVKPRVVGTLKGQGDTVTVRKGVSIPLRIFGPFTDLQVRPEVDAATVLENAPALLKGKGGKLGRILEKLPQQKQQQEPQTPPKPEEQIKRAIEGLIPGL